MRTLDKWQVAVGAKFNEVKMQIIPIGSPNYRSSVIRSRRTNSLHDPLEPHLKIVDDSNPVRILGAWLGNKMNDLAVGQPQLDKIDRSLKRWDKMNPSLIGR
jgi:hypothetical protein